MNVMTELAVTLSDALYSQLCRESRRLGLPLEWLVASLVVDTMDKSESVSLRLATG